jgi:hypothetical protein
MHHRRKRTTRREVKRNSRKKLRGAERKAMHGRPADTVGLDWSHDNLNRETPVINEEPRHRKMSRKHPPKKEKCAAGGSHSWARSEEITKDFYRNEITDCGRCVKLHKDWNRMAEWYNSIFPTSPTYKGPNPYDWAVKWNRCSKHGTKVFYNVTRTFRTCDKCGLKQHINTDNESFDYRRNKDLTLPKRRVKLY